VAEVSAGICTSLLTDNHANTPPLSFFYAARTYTMILKLEDKITWTGLMKGKLKREAESERQWR